MIQTQHISGDGAPLIKLHSTFSRAEDEYQMCDFCRRRFCPNAFDRHVEFCREKSSRLQETHSDQFRTHLYPLAIHLFNLFGKLISQIEVGQSPSMTDTSSLEQKTHSVQTNANPSVTMHPEPV